MNGFSKFLVDHRRLLCILTLVFAAFTAALFPKINVITDMATFLPDDSSMKQGYDILDSEFPDLMALSSNSVRVMFTGVPEEEKVSLQERLSAIEYVSSVTFVKDDPHYDRDGHSLYIVNFSFPYKSAEMKSIVRSLKNEFGGLYDMVYASSDTNGGSLPLYIVAIAIVCIITILLVMSSTWIEPFLFLLSVGLAVLINTGLCALTSGVAATTWAIAALLQLVLSIDYAVMLMSRYHQERDKYDTAEETMKAALAGAFPSIAASSFTTVVGLLALVFMSIKIGADMGIVLARGVFVSLVCILTFLPGMIVACDRMITASAKKRLHIPLGFLGKYEDKGRYFVLVFFILFFALTTKFRNSASFAFTMMDYTAIDEVFDSANTTIVVYNTADEEKAAEAAERIAALDGSDQVLSWATTFGKSFTADELKEMIAMMAPGTDVPGAAIDLFYAAAKTSSGVSLFDRDFSMTVDEILDKITAPEFKDTLSTLGLPEETLAMLDEAPAKIDEYKKLIRQDEHSLMVLNTCLPAESEETFSWIDAADACFKDAGMDDYHLIGNSVMAWEMAGSFSDELNKITLITAGMIFLVVLFTFRSLITPAILVLLIQSSVFFTMILIHLQGFDIYYLALLVVQSVLMGATIDYGILFTSYYREMRSLGHSRAEALTTAYNNSADTIFTSGLIMIIVTIILGYAYDNPAIGQICLTISKGATTAVILIVFVLPGLLAALDFKDVKKKGE